MKSAERWKKKNAMLANTPAETALEKVISAKTKKATEASTKLISNKEPVLTVSSKLKSAKKGLKKECN